MADARFCVGFSKACKQAREGGGLPGYEPARGSRGRALRPFLPPDIVRLIDALVRRLEHEDTLLRMNGGVLGATLCEAAAAGGLRDVRFLLARGADVEHMTLFVNEDDTEELQWPPLIWAANGGHVAVCSALLDGGAVRLGSSLTTASFAGRAPVVALLLDRGADVHFQEDESLLNAAYRDHLAVVTLLLDRGADVHANSDGPLRVAASRGQLEMVTLLLDRGADVHGAHEGALFIASYNGHVEMVRLLLDRGADIHADNEGALQGHAAVVALLLERGALEPQED